ncbi:hypothetical protein [Metallosphaera javensis (ex Sakai et al. 2022)]|uniref:hypothetical protein n=1 Tax=Metallosphaera javensis (ex Sakai et al. 2022) TaxID=2775498 RepID=UPI002586013D|nr:MAG: hypothetical protein MjAS7_2029 [Metallosphaera javensis (ex Sakai et al. 2022)]
MTGNRSYRGLSSKKSEILLFLLMLILIVLGLHLGSKLLLEVNLIIGVMIALPYETYLLVSSRRRPIMPSPPPQNGLGKFDLVINNDSNSICMIMDIINDKGKKMYRIVCD